MTIITDLQTLINNLKLLESNEEVKHFLNEDEERDYIYWVNYEEILKTGSPELQKLTQDIMSGLCAELITNQGQNNGTNRVIVNRAGFGFVKGEEDSFGPLTSVIVLKDFRICYG